MRTAARAKINLFLSVTGRRDDGYHTLETVFQQVGLRDDVALALHTRGGISVRTNKRFLPADSRNLAFRAAEVFFAAAQIQNPGLYINIKKRIPVGGGMAGGSADAAAVLDILDRAFQRPLGRERLIELGLGLGADVPFCLMGGAALATGIGERLSPSPPMPPCFLVACRPEVAVSTKMAFALLDQADLPEKRPPVSAMADALARQNLEAVCAALHNDFEAPIMARWPELGELKAWLLEHGALGAMMTGTGSVVFGVYRDAAAAQEAARALGRRYREVFVTRPE